MLFATASDPSFLSLLPRLLVSMAIVIAVMWFAARMLKGRQLPGSGGMRIGSTSKREPIVQVIGKQGVGKGAAVAVVRAGDRTFAVGVTDHNVTLIAELGHIDLDAPVVVNNAGQMQTPYVQPEAQWTGPLADATDVASNPAWKGLIDQVREKTVRRA